jgi:mRNA interferase RelE/StbE
MTFELAFLEDALKEWERLDRPIREQFRSKLRERLESPRLPSAKLSGHKDRYKIKLRSVGYRLVYEVRDQEVVVVVVAVGRRDRNAIYKAAADRTVPLEQGKLGTTHRQE